MSGLRWVLALLGVISLSGCSILGERKVGEYHFYLLQPIAAGEEANGSPPGANALAIGVGPVEIPEYLDRPNIVTRAGENEIVLADFAQWAEPFGSHVSRVLMENLVAKLGTDRVIEYPRAVSIPIDYQVAVHVIRFDAVLTQEAVLFARWGLFSGSEGKEIVAHTSRLREPLAEGGYPALVAAQSRLLGRLSGEIAAEIRQRHSR
jgi:uncharacterized lipoprotein YmbA